MMFVTCKWFRKNYKNVYAIYVHIWRQRENENMAKMWYNMYYISNFSIKGENHIITKTRMPCIERNRVDII